MLLLLAFASSPLWLPVFALLDPRGQDYGSRRRFHINLGSAGMAEDFRARLIVWLTMVTLLT